MDHLGRELYLTYRVMRERLDTALAAAGSALPQWIVLRTVAETPGMAQRTLADRILVAGSTLTHHLDRLEADGLIRRQRDQEDRRVVRIHLTTRGERRWHELAEVVADYEQRLRALVTPATADHLGRLLVELRTAMEADQVEEAS